MLQKITDSLFNILDIHTLRIFKGSANRLRIVKEPEVNDYTSVQLDRICNYYGGSIGYVGTNLVATTIVSPQSNKNFEWNALFILDNNATPEVDPSSPGNGAVPQNCAFYSQAKKNSGASTWGGCIEIQDNVDAVSGAAIGLEMTTNSKGNDAEVPQRNAHHVAIGCSHGTGTEWGRGFWVSTDITANAKVRYAFDCDGYVTNSVLRNKATGTETSCLIKDEGTLPKGIDLTKTFYTTGMAVGINYGNSIWLGNDGKYKIRASTVGPSIAGRLNMENSFSINSYGNVTFSATAGPRILPDAPDGFISILVDGVHKKIPYYNP